MSYKNIMLFVAVVGVVVAAIGVTWQIASNNNSNGNNQSSAGNSSPNISVSGNADNANINVTVGSEKKGLNIPRYEGQIQPLSKKYFEEAGNKFDGGSKFNAFMLENDGKIVYLDIWPYYTDEDDNNPNFDRFAELEWFSVLDKPYDHQFGGVEYNIRATKNSDFYYDLRPSSRRIYGHFKIVGIQGPQMGFMSVLMKPVSIENAELLKK